MFDKLFPVSLMNDLIEEMWIESMFAQPSVYIPAASPAVNIEQTENNIDIQLSLPGLSRSDIDVTVEHGVLTVATAECHEENTSRVTSWTSHGTTSTWALPVGAQLHQISSRYEAGVLTVSIPFASTEHLSIPVE